MNQVIKRNLISSIICFLLGVICLLFLFFNAKMVSEDALDYISGFSSGLIMIGVIKFVKYIRIMKNEEKSKKFENYANDERLKSLNHLSMALTFRISVLVEAIISSICTVYHKIEIASLLGGFVCFQLVLYFVIYFIVTKKN